jgi:hypothetical protein
LAISKSAIARTGIATAALDQPGDEGWAYDRGQPKWQPMNRDAWSADEPVLGTSSHFQGFEK